MIRILPLSFSYNELLFIIDTCQGASMYERFYSPNIMALASSQVGEDSLSVSVFPLLHVFYESVLLLDVINRKFLYFTICQDDPV